MNTLFIKVCGASNGMQVKPAITTRTREVGMETPILPDILPSLQITGLFYNYQRPGHQTCPVWPLGGGLQEQLMCSITGLCLL